MSTESLGTCPDCGQEYKDPMEVLPRPAERLEVKEMPWPEWTAEVHRDNECPVQKEREHRANLEAALRYFGIADTLTLLGEIVRENEHDGEIVLGDAERWIKKEQQPADDLDEQEFSTRTKNALRYAGITTIQQVSKKTERQLLSLKDFGKKALNEVRAALKARGLSIVDDIPR